MFNTYNHHYTEAHFTFSIFVSMVYFYRIYVISLSFLASFSLSLITSPHLNRRTCFFVHFLEYLLFFWITWMKKANNFQKGKVKPQRCCLAFAWFFTIFSLALLIKVLLMKKKLVTIFIFDDVELNPGPKNTKSSSYFSLCHWNLNSFPPHDFSKLSLIEAYITHLNFDMICLSETYLDSSNTDNDTRLNLKDFTFDYSR